MRPLLPFNVACTEQVPHRHPFLITLPNRWVPECVAGNNYLMNSNTRNLLHIIKKRSSQLDNLSGCYYRTQTGVHARAEMPQNGRILASSPLQAWGLTSSSAEASGLTATGPDEAQGGQPSVGLGQSDQRMAADGLETRSPANVEAEASHAHHCRGHGLKALPPSNPYQHYQRSLSAGITDRRYPLVRQASAIFK